MNTASDVILATAGFLGIGSNRPLPEPKADCVAEMDPPASAALLAPGEPYFEAVAAALRRTGYLDA